MDTAAEFDTWSAGDAYERYMGRWSQQIAAGADWLDIGCGTGPLTEAITRIAAPSSVLAIDPSADFLAFAVRRLADARVTFAQAEAEQLPSEDDTRVVAVSGLTLNFIPDPVAALREMRRVAKPGGAVAFYVWDYPGGSPAFLDAFWQSAISLDPDAAALHEVRRFATCTESGLTALAAEAGLPPVAVARLEIRTEFASFEELWEPFTLGAGPAPGYCRSLPPARQSMLKNALSDRLVDGPISLPAGAWAIRMPR